MDNQFQHKLSNLSLAFDRYVLDQPDVLDQLPPESTLVLLDADDAEFNRRNIQLNEEARRQAQERGEALKPLVYATLRTEDEVKVVTAPKLELAGAL